MTTFKEIELCNQDADRWVNTIVHNSAEWDCWLGTAYDMNGDQVGESDTEYRKKEAIETALACFESDRGDAVSVYTKDGKLQVQKISDRVTGGSPFGGDE